MELLTWLQLLCLLRFPEAQQVCTDRCVSRMMWLPLRLCTIQYSFRVEFYVLYVLYALYAQQYMVPMYCIHIKYTNVLYTLNMSWLSKHTTHLWDAWRAWSLIITCKIVTVLWLTTPHSLNVSPTYVLHMYVLSLLPCVCSVMLLLPSMPWHKLLVLVLHTLDQEAGCFTVAWACVAASSYSDHRRQGPLL